MNRAGAGSRSGRRKCAGRTGNGTLEEDKIGDGKTDRPQRRHCGGTDEEREREGLVAQRRNYADVSD